MQGAGIELISAKELISDWVRTVNNIRRFNKDNRSLGHHPGSPSSDATRRRTADNRLGDSLPTTTEASTLASEQESLNASVML